MKMATTWISPWNGNPVSVEELICEVALATISRMYVFSTLGSAEPLVSIESDSIIIKSAKIDYCYEIYYPHELNDEMQHCFSPCLQSLKNEYGLYVAENPLKVSGEHLGEMLRRFQTFERMLRLVSARHCWDNKAVLALHGLMPSQFLASLKNEFDRADINYLVLLPLNDELGSGVFKAITIGEAIQLIGDLREEIPRAAEQLLGLEDSYGPYTWASNNFNWAQDEGLIAGAKAN
jgi:hypothetical protein